MESTVKQVIGVAHKKDGSELRGVGQKGEWSMYEVILENGTKMNVFAPVEVGDTVYNLEQDLQYHNWKGKVRKQGATPNVGQPTNAQILHAIEELKQLITKGKPMTQDEFNDTLLSDEEEDKINPQEIPF